jgi:chromosome segregation ATPase
VSHDNSCVVSQCKLWEERCANLATELQSIKDDYDTLRRNMEQEEQQTLELKGELEGLKETYEDVNQL